MDHLDLEQIQSFLKAKLPPQVHARVLQHLSACAACRQSVNDERRFAHLLNLADLPSLDLPAATRVLKRVTTSQKRRGWRQKAAQAIVLVLLPAGGFLMGSYFRQPSAVPPTDLPPPIARPVLAHLSELEQLQQWRSVVEHLPLVRTFAQLLGQRTLPRQG